jgi:deoxyhypusine synthase
MLKVFFPRQRNWRLSQDPIEEDEDERYLDPETRKATKCHIMLGFTSNLISSGLREIIRFLVQHRYVSGIVTTAGGIEEDLVKCLGSTYVAPDGRFDVDGATLRSKGLNRIGNLIVPNNNYCAFEDWIMPIFDQMVKEQPQRETPWSPSTVIARLGKEIDNEESYLYWAQKVSSLVARHIDSICYRTTSLSFAQHLQTVH